MKTGKNRVKGLKSELFKKYQTDPVVLNPSSQNNIPSWGQPEVTPLITNIEDIYKGYDPYNTQYAKNAKSFDFKTSSMLSGLQEKDKEKFAQSNIIGPVFPYQNIQADVKGGTEPVTKEDEKNLTIGQTTSTINDGTKPKETYTWKDYTRMGLGMLDTALSLNEDVKNRNEMNRRIRETNDIPRYDANYYQFAGRPGSQKTIFAKEGAEIRTGTDTGAEEAELERGEYFILPNGDEYSVGGKKHSQGGEKFVLPEGTIVFSDYLKIPGTGKTFAQEARKYPLDKYSEVLKNQHAKSVDKNTAQILYDRNSKKLMQLFQMQQAMNGNSNGELKEEVEGKRGMLYGQAGLYNGTDVSSGLGISDALPNWARLSNQMQVSMAQNAQQINAEQYRNQQLPQVNNTPPAFSLDERGRPYVQTMLANPDMQYPLAESAPKGYNNALDMIDVTPEELASSMSSVFDKLGITDSEKRAQYIAQMVGKANQGYLWGTSGLARQELNTKYPNTPKSEEQVIQPFLNQFKTHKEYSKDYDARRVKNPNYANWGTPMYATDWYADKNSELNTAKKELDDAKEKFNKGKISEDKLKEFQDNYDYAAKDLEKTKADYFKSVSGPFGGYPINFTTSYLNETNQNELTTNTGVTGAQTQALVGESFVPGLDPKAIQQTVNSLMQGLQFDNKEQATKAREELTKEIQIKAAAKIDANSKTTTGADKSLNVPVNTATNNVKKEADPNASGTVTDGNAADINSRYWTEVIGPGGVKRKVWKEGQGAFAGKSLSSQYADNPILLFKNRLNENYDVLAPVIMDAYKGQLKDKKLATGKVEDIVDVIEGGNNSLVKLRQFFTSIGKEDALFDPQLDRFGTAGENKDQKKTLDLFREYVESSKFKQDVAANPGLLSMPWVKGKITKNADGSYSLDKDASIDKDFVEKYQAAYRAIGAVKKQQPKDKDLLKGFRINPEGLPDQMWLGLPISPVDRIGANTTIGQIVGFEDEEFRKKKEPPPSPDVVTTSPGGPVPGKVGPAPEGSYEKAIFDIAQLAPEFYGLANSEIFPYVPFDYNAPYIMPQTLNIQPQLQDIDNSYVAALRAGADPNAAFISSLNAKQRIYSEKQNFDAQQRAAADQQNAQYRWQEDVQDINSLDRVYNTLIAQADDARTSQIQDIVRSATQKRNVWNFEENRKKLYIDNFVRNYKWDGNTGQATLSNPQGYDPFNIAMTAEMLNAAYGIKPTTKTTTTTSKTATEPSKTTTSVTTTAEEEKKKKEAAKK